MSGNPLCTESGCDCEGFIEKGMAGRYLRGGQAICHCHPRRLADELEILPFDCGTPKPPGHVRGDVRKAERAPTPTDATQAGRDALNAAADCLDKLNNTGGMVAFLRVYAGGYRAGDQ